MTPITPAMTPARSASPLTVSMASAVAGCGLIATRISPLWYGIAATNVAPSDVPLAKLPPAAAELTASRTRADSVGGAPADEKSSRRTLPSSLPATRPRVAGVTFFRAAVCASCSATLSA